MPDALGARGDHPWISESPAARPSSAPRAAGSGAPAPCALAEAGCEVVVNGRDPQARSRRPPPISAGDRRQGASRSRPTSRTPEGQAALFAACPEPDILVEQQCRPAVPRFPRARPPEDDRRRDRQHGRAGRADSRRRSTRWSTEEVRPHRQHHLGLGEDAAGRARPVLRRARRPDRVPRRRRALGRAAQRHHQFPAAGRRSTPTGCAPTSRRTAKKQGITVRAGAKPTGWRRCRPSGFGTPDEFGAACAFLCSAHAGYITGQNLLIDGGIFPGAFRAATGTRALQRVTDAGASLPHTA